MRHATGFSSNQLRILFFDITQQKLLINYARANFNVIRGNKSREINI